MPQVPLTLNSLDSSTTRGKVRAALRELRRHHKFVMGQIQRNAEELRRHFDIMATQAKLAADGRGSALNHWGLSGAQARQLADRIDHMTIDAAHTEYTIELCQELLKRP